MDGVAVHESHLPFCACETRFPADSFLCHAGHVLCESRRHLVDVGSADGRVHRRHLASAGRLCARRINSGLESRPLNQRRKAKGETMPRKFWAVYAVLFGILISMTFLLAQTGQRLPQGFTIQHADGITYVCSETPVFCTGDINSGSLDIRIQDH